jgi:hypothetical protein
MLTVNDKIDQIDHTDQKDHTDQINQNEREMRLVNRKFDIPADALDYFYNCKYFSPNSVVYIKLTKETQWFPRDIGLAKEMAKSWATSLKERNRLFSKCAINIMFDLNVRAITFRFRENEHKLSTDNGSNYNKFDSRKEKVACKSTRKTKYNRRIPVG